jgi:ParB family chromosome partitioning protein
MDMHTESLQDLADSIRVQGVVQPIVVRPVGPNRYEIIAGERRWRASQLAGLHDIPALIKDVPDQAAIAMALIENIQRENLNPLEEANALQRLIDEFDMTHQQAAEAVGRSRAAVSNILRLRELTDDVKNLLDNNKLEMGHARALLGLSGAEQAKAAHEVARKGLSVRETETLVRKQLAGATGKKTPGSPPALDPDVRRLQDDLSERLGAKVAVQCNKQGKGKLVIQYNSLDELDGILAHIK